MKGGNKSNSSTLTSQKSCYTFLRTQAKIITSNFLSLRSESWMLSHNAANVIFLVSLVGVIYKKINLEFWETHKTISSFNYSWISHLLHHEPPQRVAVESLVLLLLFFFLKQLLNRICGEKRQQKKKNETKPLLC